MNSATYCFVILLIISSSSRRSFFADAGNQLVLLYHPYEETYSLNDLETIQNRPPASSVSEYTHIVSFCAVRGRLPVHSDFLLEIEQIVSATSFRNGENGLAKCRPAYKAQPVTLYQPNYRAYTVSYIIRTDSLTKEMLRKNHLDKAMFPNNYVDENDPVSHMYIFWAYFNSETLQLSQTRHRLSVYDENAGRPKCDEYDIPDARIDYQPPFSASKFYDKEEQEKLMKKFRWPKDNEYFVRHQFVPIDDFTDEYSRKATCTYLNIVPVWRTISEGSLRRLQEYIRKVALILPLDTLTVHTIAYEQLQLLPMKWRSTVREPVFLNMDEKKIPVPKVIINIVSYEIPFPTSKHKVREYLTYKEVKGRYKMAIVIHNEINEGVQPICTYRYDCQEYGWYVTDNGNDENVYCCDIYSRLFADYGYHKREDKALNLNSVPLSDGAFTVIEPVNVVEKLRELEKL